MLERILRILAGSYNATERIAPAAQSCKRAAREGAASKRPRIQQPVPSEAAASSVGESVAMSLVSCTGVPLASEWLSSPGPPAMATVPEARSPFDTPPHSMGPLTIHLPHEELSEGCARAVWQGVHDVVLAFTAEVQDVSSTVNDDSQATTGVEA